MARKRRRSKSVIFSISLKLSESYKKVTIYTDGACVGNPGPGGYGIVLLYGEHRRELSGGCQHTTNNRMELLAAIRGLEALKECCEVRLLSDSQYVVNGIMKGWARRWRANGWRRNKDGFAENRDLWEQLLQLCEKHRVVLEWVRGHAGNSENERCDQLATTAARGSNLPVDSIYENSGRSFSHG
jgi:ribonuclease HI